MTDEEFALGVDAILMTGVSGHPAHRALDILWTRYTQELPEGHALRVATAKWMSFIEGDHSEANPYPLGRKTWLQRPLACKFGLHDWIAAEDLSGWRLASKDCRRCGAHEGSGNPCP